MPLGLFKTEWEKRPHDWTTYPPFCQEFILHYQTLWTREAAQLERLNIPVPTVVKPMITTYEEKKEDRKRLKILKISHTQHLIPPHITFKVANSTMAETRFYGFIDLSMKPESEARQIIEAGQAALVKKDILSIVESHQVRWFSREPYYNFEDYNKRGATNYYLAPETHEYPPVEYISNLNLKEVTGFTADELKTIKLRLSLLDCCSTPIIDTTDVGDIILRDKLSEPNRVYVALSENYVQQTPVPNWKAPEAQTTLKILPDLNARPAVAEQLLKRLHSLTNPIIFSIVAEQNTVSFQLSCATDDRAEIERQISIHFPNFSILAHIAPPNEAALHIRSTCPQSSHLYLNTLRSFTLDPYHQLFALYSQLNPEDCAAVRIYFTPIPNQTIEAICTVLGSHYRNIPRISGLADERIQDLKIKLPAWGVRVRLESTNQAALEALHQSFLNQYQTPNQTWYVGEHPTAFNILDTAELAALAHFPDKTVECDLLETASMKAKLPPDLYTQTGVIIGRSEARGQTKSVTIPDSVRDRHAYIVGKSGTGKSTLLFNAIRQDIERGHGVAVIDPHGDLVEEVLHHIPESRIEDTIYFNAADKDHPIGLNILNAQSDDEIGLLADDLLITFKRLSESWGERMENILRHCFHTLLRAEDATFLDIKTLLQNPDYRQQVAAQSNNRMLRDFWQLEYVNYPKDAAQPILNRMSKFSLSPTLTGILGQPDSSLNFFDVIQNKKILLVNISKGQIGEDTAQLLGSLIVSQLQLAIMRRAALPKESRDPYYLYVDEFQNFTTSAFEKILSEARKYKLCLTLAHQYISQLDERTKNAILANVGTIVMFQSYPADAQALRPELGQYEPSDVTNLNTAEHQALCKPSTQSKDTFMFQTLAPPPKPESFAREIIEFTRENYATTPIQYGEPVRIAYSPPPPDTQASPKFPRPARALPKEFANTGDKILHYVNQAEWLATPQIHELVYSHISEAARASNASRDLKALVEAKRIKFQNFGKSKIYYTGRQINPTTHNLAIRDLFAKIVASNYELAEVNFFPQLPSLTPDLAVSFLNDDGTQTKSFWEYDAGTEGIAELLKKVSRYDILAKDSLVVFVFSTKERLHQFAKAARAARIVAAVINEFTTLDDGVFVFLQLQGGETASEASSLFV